jgi:6-phosphofructokinase 2
LGRKSKVALVTINPTLDILFEGRKAIFNHKLFSCQSKLAAGGSAINIARGLHTLGLSPALYIVAGGEIGTLMKSQLVKENIPFSCFPNNKNTRITSIYVQGKKRHMLVAPSPEFGHKLIQSFINRYYTEIAENDIVLIGGSVPEHSAKIFIAKFIRPLIKRGVKVIVDSRGILQRSTSRELPFILKYNIETATNIKRNIQVVQKYYRNGVSIVLFYTKNYCYAIFEDYIWRFPNFTKYSSRSFGRGDAFLAGLIYALLNARGKEEAVRHAIACGASFKNFFPLGNISLDMIPKYFNKLHCIGRKRIP